MRNRKVFLKAYPRRKTAEQDNRPPFFGRYRYCAGYNMNKDIVFKLLDHNWREFENKVSLEWKLSFGLWGALIAILYAIYEKKIEVKDESIFFISAGLLIIVLHIWFVIWIQTCLKKHRSRLHEFRSILLKKINILDYPKFKRGIINQPTVVIQITITIILVSLICYKIVSPV